MVIKGNAGVRLKANEVDISGDSCTVVFCQSAKRQSGADLSTRTIPGEQTQPVKSQADKNTEKVRSLSNGSSCGPLSWLWWVLLI